MKTTARILALGVLIVGLCSVEANAGSPAALAKSLQDLHEQLHYPLILHPAPSHAEVKANPHRKAQIWDSWPVIEQGRGWSRRLRPDGEIRMIIGPWHPFPNPLMRLSPELEHYRK